jgi:hypothetical protein
VVAAAGGGGGVGGVGERHGLFHDAYRARIFSFSDSALIGDAPMTISIRSAEDLWELAEDKS